MSISFDNGNTNNLEKALSVDENDRDTIMGRHLAEIMRALAGTPTVLGFQAVGGSDFTLTDPITRTRIWGLNIAAIATGPRRITIGPGLMFVNSGTESPGSLDSTYRVGFNPANVDITVPAADDLFHLLECRVINTNVSENRDILTNPSANSFTNQSVVKQKLKRLSFQIITGTATAIPVPTAGWQPVYAFQILNSAPNTLPIISQVIDLRTPPTADKAPRTEDPGADLWRGMDQVLSRGLVTATRPAVSNSQNVSFDFRAIVDGLDLHFKSRAATTLTPFLESALATPLADTIHYLYLCPAPAAWGSGYVGNVVGGVPGNPEVVGNCILAVSITGPGNDGRNSATITLKQPFAGTVIPVRTAVCVGAVTQTSGGTGWEGQVNTTDGNVRFMVPLEMAAITNLHTILTLSTTAALSFPATRWPAHLARMVKIRIGMSTRTPAQTFANSKLRASPFNDEVGVDNSNSVLVDPLLTGHYVEREIPIPNIVHVATSLQGMNVLIAGTGAGGQPTGPLNLSEVVQNGAVFSVVLVGYSM